MFLALLVVGAAFAVYGVVNAAVVSHQGSEIVGKVGSAATGSLSSGGSKRSVDGVCTNFASDSTGVSTAAYIGPSVCGNGPCTFAP